MSNPINVAEIIKEHSPYEYDGVHLEYFITEEIYPDETIIGVKGYEIPSEGKPFGDTKQAYGLTQYTYLLKHGNKWSEHIIALMKENFADE